MKRHFAWHIVEILTMMAKTRKVLSITNLKNSRDDTKIHVEKAMQSLEYGINTILNSEEPKIALQELYSIVENLHNTHRNKLYEKLQDLLEESLLHKLDLLLSNTQDLLTSVNFLWTEFCKHISTIKNIFLNCDRSKYSSKFNTVHQLSTDLFKSVIILNSKIKNNLTLDTLHLIQLHRKGNEIDKKLLQSVLEMLTVLQIYEEVFQTDFFNVSNIFYADEGNILINIIDIRTYLRHAQARIREEQERAEYYLNKYASTAISEIVYKNLVKDHLDCIIKKSFNHLQRGIIEEELGILYNLVRKVSQGLKTLSQYFVEYILKQGALIVNRPENDKTLIQELLDFKDKLDNIVKTYFRNNEVFSNIIRNSFIKFINSKQNKPGQLLAKYIDLKLRSKDISEDDLEVLLDKVMVLFRYIQGKDIFEAFYKKDLAKRLLLGKSTSQDAEDSMIGKLKAECGAAFTAKIEGMFKDVNISQGMNNAFKQHLINNATYSSDLCINILTSSFWPNYPTHSITLPPELMNYQVCFQKFYAINHSGRKLVWQPSLGHCIVKALFENGNKELQVSLFQTIVLLLFNDTEKLTFSEIHELTNMESDELKRTLISLACTKTRVLLKQSKVKDIENDDVFCINHKFNDKLFRVKINQIQLKESVEEQQATEKSVLADRQFQIDAAVVRILKDKKKISHNELISELFNTLDIPVKPYDLKKRIELLIEREYMERDKDDSSNYVYIA